MKIALNRGWQQRENDVSGHNLMSKSFQPASSRKTSMAVVRSPVELFSKFS